MLVFWQAAPCVASGGASMAPRALALPSPPAQLMRLSCAPRALTCWVCTTYCCGGSARHVAMVTIRGVMMHCTLLWWRNVAMESMRATYCGDRVRRVAIRCVLLWRWCATRCNGDGELVDIATVHNMFDWRWTTCRYGDSGTVHSSLLQSRLLKWNICVRFTGMRWTLNACVSREMREIDSAHNDSQISQV